MIVPPRNSLRNRELLREVVNTWLEWTCQVKAASEVAEVVVFVQEGEVAPFYEKVDCRAIVDAFGEVTTASYGEVLASNCC